MNTINYVERSGQCIIVMAIISDSLNKQGLNIYYLRP